jgi:cytochrome c-type biogenesis protein CcmH
VTLSRREFLAALGTTAAAAALSGRRGLGQAAQSTDQAPRTTMSGPMDEAMYHSVTRPPKPNARASMSAAERDALEHNLHCQCGCTLDVYTCRTTDFTCPVSPGMHQDVLRLVAGGYSGPEILAAFRSAYGERVLMAPVREGLNWAAYVAPFVALGAGGTAIAVMIRRWRAPATVAGGSSDTPDAPGAPGVAGSASPEELARLDAAVRHDAR